jgi:hypothetical protein
VFLTYVVEGAISTDKGLEDAGDVEQRLLSDANFRVAGIMELYSTSFGAYSSKVVGIGFGTVEFNNGMV